MDINGKVIVITGGASGLGQATARYMVNEKGARVALFDLNREAGTEEQPPEYFAFEAVQRNHMTRTKCLFVCTQLGLDEEAAQTAIDNVCIPWRTGNGWRSYVQLDADGIYTLMNKAPVKIKLPLARLKERCQALLS